MFSNYLKVALRNLLRHKLYSFINMFGLAVGICAIILILAYIEFELSFDDFQANGKHIYRVSVKDLKEGNIESESPVFVAALGPAMLRDIPEVENYVRLRTPRTEYLSSGVQSLKVEGIVYADSTFFDVFSFHLISGDTKEALQSPFSIVLTPSLSQTLFGTEDPIGKMVRINGGDSYRVAGIVRDPPGNSSIKFRALISFSTLYRQPDMFLGWNGGNQYVTYVRLRANTRPEDVNRKFPPFMWRYINQENAAIGVRYDPYLQPFVDIHLLYDEGSAAIRANIYIFASIAIVVLMIACMNFVNLTTARSARRAKEIGVRKVLGANKPMLIGQFFTESFLITLLATICALLMAELVFPVYKTLISEDIGTWNVLHSSTILDLVILVLVVGFIAGAYPAFYLSSFQAAKVLKSGTLASGTRGTLRSILITFQFAVSIAMIVCTTIVGTQLQHLKNQKLGFNKNNIVVLPLVGKEARSKSDLLKREILGLSGVISASASSDVPISDFTSNGYFPEGHNSPLMIHVVDVDDDYLKTFGIEVAKGRGFSTDFASDKSAYLINQTLANTLKWESPIGKTIQRDGLHTIIGVVKDFNFATLHSPIKPLIITHEPWGGQFDDLSVKLGSADIAGTMKAMENVWQKSVPSSPFSYWFLDESFDHLYRAEERFETLFMIFAGLSIWIALMGLVSLASFATEERRKEIGVRKVFGASVLSVTGLMSKQFLKWVLVANIIAWPAAYYFMSLWLQDFAYRIDLTVWPFLAGGVAALLLGWVSVSFQTVKAALANPVDALRYE